MKELSSNIILLFFLFILLLSCTFALQGTEEGSKTLISKKASVDIKEIAVAPFSTNRDLLEGELKELVLKRERFLTENLYSELKNRMTDVEFAPLLDSTSQYAQLTEQNPDKTHNEVSVMVGDNLNVDAVVTGIISRFEERKGSELGIEFPASVAFSVQLFDVKNRIKLWEEFYSETQEPLLSDVSKVNKFLERGGKWVTAGKLAEEGIALLSEKLSVYLNKI